MTDIKSNCYCYIEILETDGPAKAGRPARTYIQQLCEDTGCSLEDLPEAMNDRGEVAREGQGYPCLWHDMMIMMTWNCMQKKLALARLKMLSTKYAFTNQYLICIKRIWHQIIYKYWYVIKPNQPTIKFWQPIWN